jgi:hypothetical protein
MVWLAGLAVTEGALLIVSASADEALPLKMPSPLYAAVIECGPEVRVEVEKLACPKASKGSVSTTVVPSLKSTVPLGVPILVITLLTVTANVTACPKHDGLAEELSVVELSNGCASAGPALSQARAQARTTHQRELVLTKKLVSKNIATARPFIRLGKQSQRRDAPAASLNHGLILPCTRIIKFSVEQSRDIPKDGNRSGTRLWPR